LAKALPIQKKIVNLHSKSARTGCTSAIQACLIALGLHHPCSDYTDDDADKVCDFSLYRNHFSTH